MNPLRRYLAANPPEPRYPWGNVSPEERQAWLDAHYQPPRLAPAEEPKGAEPHALDRTKTCPGQHCPWLAGPWLDPVRIQGRPIRFDDGLLRSCHRGTGSLRRPATFVVVDVKPTNETILKRSGGYETTKRVPGDDCAHCQGTGKEPEGWTYEEALAKPREFNLDHTNRQTPGAVPLMAHVVSPLYFDEAGQEKCVKCSGMGHTWKLEQVSVDWPEFSPNPARKLWHVEKDGRILDSGIGLGPCADWDQERAQAAVERIVNRIEDAIHSRHDGTTADPTVVGVTPSTSSDVIRRNPAKNGIEVVFPAKPGADVRAGLKRLRFRWSRRQGLWYARYSARLWEEVHELLNITDPPPEQEDDEPDEIPNPLLDAAVESLTAPPLEPAPVPATPPVRAGPSAAHRPDRTVLATTRPPGRPARESLAVLAFGPTTEKGNQHAKISDLVRTPANVPCQR